MKSVTVEIRSLGIKCSDTRINISAYLGYDVWDEVSIRSSTSHIRRQVKSKINEECLHRD